MAENQSNNNRLVMILAATVVVLFIAFVAVVVLSKGNQTAATTTTTATTGVTTAPSTTSTATSNPGVGASTAFDPATATKVPAGKAPQDFVSGYYQAILDKKWDVAFKMQPAASQQGTVADFQSTQTMYGMKAFTVKSSVVGSTEATVVVQQDLGTNGLWTATWNFVKDSGNWLVKERKVAMGAAQ